MKALFSIVLYFLVRFSLWLRYSIKVEGLESLNQDTLDKPGGTLFLANHPAETDPPILLSTFWRQFKPHPLALDSIFHKKGVGFLLRYIGALSVPNFEDSSNSYKRRTIENTYAKVFSLLRNKESVLLYPSGCLKHGAKEIIGGASGVHRILSECPDINIVLVRTTGLWGSSFSRALTGKSPDLGPTFMHGFKVLLKNGVFFAPRRKVVVQCEVLPTDFPFEGDRREINQYLENWYNRGEVEPLKLVSYSFWKKDFPKIIAKKPAETAISLQSIPSEVQEEIIQELARLTKRNPEEIEPSAHLAQDLGLDSLDLSQLVIYLKDEYGLQQLHSTDLTTVESVMAFASHLKSAQKQKEEIQEKGIWVKEKGRPSITPPLGKTIPEAFLRKCDEMDGFAAALDALSGRVTYRQLKLRAIILARHIAKLPGKHIGIMLPASVAVNTVILATMLAKKVPVMINWTLGPRNLNAVVQGAKIKVVLSSWAFLDRLENADLGDVDERICLLEEMRNKITLRDKVSGLLLANRKTRALLQKFKLQSLKEDDPAVILFTSGTENLPKGVPLSHKNLLENQRGAFKLAALKDKDVLLGILPPFHSFGFSVTGLFPLLSGLRVAFSPNPTDGRRIALAIRRWKVSLVCIAPTFLKNLLRAAKKTQLKSLRLVVAGAEKTPKELYSKLSDLNPHTTLVEGYGITECSPILTLVPPRKKDVKGVGIPLPGVELTLVHPKTHAPMSSMDEPGLILARGPNVFSGYLDPNLPSPFIHINGKMWYETGDLGVIHDSGSLTLAGRLKRFVKIGGEMVSLVAIEEVLEQASTKKGWSVPENGPCLAVCAQEEEGKKAEMTLFTTFATTLDEVNSELKQSGMSNLIRISKLKQLHALPLLGTGKVDYRALIGKI